MQFLMLVTTDSTHTPEDAAAAPDIQDWFAWVSAKGAWVTGNRLRPAEDATTVQVRDGRQLVTDGPFAETKEWIAGFDILECADLDEAIEIASRHPNAYSGRLELRPVWPLDED